MHHKRLDQSPAPKPNVCVTAEWRLRLAFEQLSGHGPLGGHHDLLTVDRPSVRERHRPEHARRRAAALCAARRPTTDDGAAVAVATARSATSDGGTHASENGDAQNDSTNKARRA